MAVLAVGLAAGLLAGCSADPPAPVPPGTTLAGDAESLLPLLERLEALTGTPVAEGAAALRERLEGCTEFVAHCPADDADCALPDEARCGAPDASERLAELRGDADWIFARGSAEGYGLILRGADSPDGGVVLDGELFPADEEGPLTLLLPAAEPPGPARVNRAEALIHARVRPDGGINVAQFIEGGDWGSRLYRLQSGLFEGTTLAGVWELAVYGPAPGELIPPMVLSLDLKSTDLAVEAMEQFLADLKETWPVRRSDFRLADWTGACLSNVRVMPDLAPCYLTTEDTLLVGWNPRSLEVALRTGESPAENPGSSGGAVYLDRLPEADAVVAESSGAFPPPEAFYPWRRIELRGAREQDHYRISLELVPR